MAVLPCCTEKDAAEQMTSKTAQRGVSWRQFPARGRDSAPDGAGPERQAGGRAGRGPHRGLTRVGAQVHGELAGVAAGVGAELALEGPLV